MKTLRKLHNIDDEVKLMLVMVVIVFLLFIFLFLNISSKYEKVYNSCIENKKLSDAECQQLAKKANNKAITRATTGAVIGFTVGNSVARR